ncbi:hypothetical protein [Cellulomonas composti]|uniref:HK97 gp10 family phage protein n=1 Tax=Cellulomonas composti TaxID=266130 RepID=A0A511JBJ6_9CELL|nr:hypothetical protein [Cellulomonas composti]GEL95356.1 hypothetical protein CCO02nite_20140 [Cellulomonas composti]
MRVYVDPESRRRADAARRAFRTLPKELKNSIRKANRAELNPIWRGAMRESVARAPYPMQRVVFKSGTRVEAGVPLYLVAGASSRRMSGGGTPMTLDETFEFGSSRQGEYTRYMRRSRRGGSHEVVRRTAHRLPPKRLKGYVVMPAVAQAMPKIIGSWSREWNRRIYEAIDGKG